MTTLSAPEPTITFLGAAGTVTGSRFLLSCGDTKVMVDAGMFQGLKELRLKNWDPFAIDPRELDAIAHEIVRRRFYVWWMGIPLDCDKVSIPNDPIPRYSASLDAAALLEKALSERGLRDENYKCLYSVVAGCIDNIAIKHGDVIEAAIFARAKSRTIAAVLAAPKRSGRSSSP